MGKTKDYTGQRFGRLVVIERLPQKPYTKANYRCKCDCGKEKTVRSSNLASGHCNSCGCIVKRHGLAKKERLYNIWVGMRQRCNNESSKDYPKYGGRGIVICNEWNDYLIFREWALSNGYSDKLSIDRMDVNGNYEPSNCRWVNHKTQANNQSNNHLITFDGKTKTIKQWSDETGISNVTILTRLTRGWSIERALTTKVTKGA
ncbi:hypothetical protein Javan273_0035 [Streptococcus phage Javan273]|nr:hypothetical protein BKX95_00365 [Streptococcus iniae]QBX16777.1 hypothetical protein Javan273_0035 [Streptococcus phage Javan273]